MIGGTLAGLFQLNLFSCPSQGSSLGIKHNQVYLFPLSWKQPQTNPRKVYSAFRNRAVRCNYTYLPGVQLVVDGMVTGSGFNHIGRVALNSVHLPLGKTLRICVGKTRAM
ncbi:hypothetical protein B0H13DRAFT_393984 [Mycena leptocephala]|nr:hypothetical protein B0H13DRAFT_393984 [Mycena leptocephala]